jgi:hypothetical protein
MKKESIKRGGGSKALMIQKVQIGRENMITNNLEHITKILKYVGLNDLLF